jgi:hypothetical protein
MKSVKQTLTVPCPDCGYEIRPGPDPQKYEKLTCPECWAYLEIINLDPIELAWENFDENEDTSLDWDDEDDVTGSKD